MTDRVADSAIRFSTHSVTHLPISRVYPRRSLRVVVDVVDSSIEVSRLFPAQRKRHFACLFLGHRQGLRATLATPTHSRPFFRAMKSHTAAVARRFEFYNFAAMSFH